LDAGSFYQTVDAPVQVVAMTPSSTPLATEPARVATLEQALVVLGWQNLSLAHPAAVHQRRNLGAGLGRDGKGKTR
jgi:hypothetical protein